MLSPLLHSWFHQLEVSFNRQAGRSGLPRWLVDNTRDPVNTAEPWSFVDHEYQKGILTCTAPHIVTKKTAQVGVTELAYRMTLALMSLYSGTNWIYVLPSIVFARKVSSTRILPAIEASPYLKTLLAKEPDSSEIRRIGNSFLFMAGAQHMRQAISIPAKGVIRDEYDFCSQSVLTAFKSRLEHNKQGEEVLLDFSTPTIGDYGISKLFEQGSQNLYLCYHDACASWTVVDPLFDLVVPGFDDELVNIEKADLTDSRIKPKEAWVRCQQCRRPIAQANLADPGRRAWVAKYPNRTDIASFYVSPFDIAAVKTPERVIFSLDSYERKQDWLNYGLGKEFTNAENSVVPAALDQHAHTEVVTPRERAMVGAYSGLDVGKQCHYVALKPNGRHLDVVWVERIGQKIRADGTDEVSERVLERMRQFGSYRHVTDAGPDLTVPQRLIESGGYHQAWACEFLRAPKRGKLDIVYPDEVEQVVQVVRTQMLDTLVGEINNGIVRVCNRHPDYEILKSHLCALKRVKRINDQGDTTVAWVSTGEDHYALGLLYARIAVELFKQDASTIPLPGAMRFSKAAVGSSVKQKGVESR